MATSTREMSAGKAGPRRSHATVVNSRRTALVRTRASGNGKSRRAQAGLIIDNEVVSVSTSSAGHLGAEDSSSLLFFQDDQQTRHSGETTYLFEEAEKDVLDVLDFDFEAEKAKLLDERKELEEFLQRMDEHETSLRQFVEESKTNTENVKTFVKSTRENASRATSTSQHLTAPSTAGTVVVSSSSPALLRRDRYRTSLQRQQEAKRTSKKEDEPQKNKKEKVSANSARAQTKTKSKSKRKSKSKKEKESEEKAARNSSSGFDATTSEESLSLFSKTTSSDPVTALLQERRHLRLLDREEEAKLIKKAQFCFKVEHAIEELESIHGSLPSYEQLALALYNSNKSSNSKEEEEQPRAISAAKLRQRHLEAMEARRFMLDHNVRLVAHVAHRYTNKGVALGDLVQEGIQGLLVALEKFDLTRSNKFSTYASWWIKQSIIRGVCNYSRDVRLPVHITDTFQKMNKIQMERKKKSDDYMKFSVTELAKMMDCSESKLNTVLESTQSAISLEILTGVERGNSGDTGPNSSDIIAKGGSDQTNIQDALIMDTSDEVGEQVDSELYEKILQEDVDAVLKMLPPRERNILRMRFGLTPIDDMCLSLVDIGAAYGLTRERVRQMEARALNKLRQPRLSTKLKKYVNSDQPDEEDAV
jgi:RNA polymerase sigma factor (sigma-70 family)